MLLRKYHYLLLILVLMVLVVVGCEPNDLQGDVYVPSLYPNAAHTGNVGGSSNPFLNGYFDNFSIAGATLAGSAYGQIYEDSTPGTDIVDAVAGTYYQWVTSTEGDSYLTTPSAATDNITVASGGAGEYLVQFSVGCQSNKPNIIVHWDVFLNGVMQARVASEHTHANINEVSTSVGVGLLHLVAGDVLDLRNSSDVNNTTITVMHATLTITRVGV